MPAILDDAPAAAPAKASDATTLLNQALVDPRKTAATLTDDLMRFAIDRGPGIIAVLLLLFVGWLLAGWVRGAVIRASAKAKIDITLGKFFGNVARWSIIGFAIITCLGTLGISTTGFAAVIGTAGLAIGLALQGNLGNLASGVLLLIFRPFKIGDSVIIAGQAGIVDGIDLLTTNLDTSDNRRIFVPNGAIMGGVIENQTRHNQRRADVNVIIAASADLAQTRAILQAAVDRVAAATTGVVKDPAPGVALTEISPVTWNVNLWAQTGNVGAVRQALLREVKLAVDGAKIAPPGPSMDVRITSMPSPV